jgi:hypothetical protein
MSQLRKSFLGPALSVACKSCGERLSVPVAAILAVTPFLFSIFLAGLLAPHELALSALSLIGGVFAMAAIHALLVPLVQRGA